MHRKHRETKQGPQLPATSWKLYNAEKQVDISTILCDLASPLVKRLNGIVDILIFNPPYVPTNQSEAHEAAQKRGIESSWAGGSNGMLVTHRLMPFVEVSLCAI